MSKTIGLKQLAQKQYVHVTGIDEPLTNCIGHIEDAFDAIIYGGSGNGKSNFTAMLLKQLLKAMNCRCEYVAYEEGHAATIQETLIHRHNLLVEVGNVMQVTDHYTFDELRARMGRRKSAKIWVLDSLQDAQFSTEQCAQLKREFVLSRKRKIIIYVSWAEGKTPMGSVAKSVEYRCNIKMRVEGYIVFPKSRYGGNKPFVIWEGDRTSGARGYWAQDFYNKSRGIPKKKPAKKTKKADEVQID